MERKRRAYTDAQKHQIEVLEGQRNRMHFERGWPWSELPPARSTFSASEKLYHSEPFVRTSNNKFRDQYLAMLYTPEKFEGMGANAPVFDKSPQLHLQFEYEDEGDRESMEFCEGCGINDSTVADHNGELLCNKCAEPE